MARNTSAAPAVCCQEQDQLLTLMSSLALFASDGVMILYGELLDRRGARCCCGVALSLCWSGFLVLGLNAWRLRNDALWMASFFCIGVAGPGVFMSMLSFGECHPALRPLITALAAAMWDSSSAVFLLFSYLYFEAQISFAAIALLWLGVVFIIGMAVWTQLPTHMQLAMLRAHGAECASGGLESGGLADLVQTPPLDATAPWTSPPGRETSCVWPPPCATPLSASLLSSAAPFQDGDKGGAATAAGAAAASAAPAASTASFNAAARVAHAASDCRRAPCNTRLGARAPCYDVASGGGSLLSLLTRGDTVLLLTFMATYNLKSSFYIVSMQSQLTAAHLAPSDVRGTSALFNLAFPIGGFVRSAEA